MAVTSTAMTMVIGLATTPALNAQTFPTRPIRVIVSFAAGGGIDILTRLVGQRMSEHLGQPVVVENKPGANGIVGAEYVARAAPDGYTLFTGPMSVMAINPAVYTKLPYALSDFAPISTIASYPLILVVSAKSPIHSLRELIAQAKADPARANVSGAALVFQLTDELFKMKTGMPLVYVNYKSSTESVTAVINGEALMTISDAGPVSGPLKSGQVRGLAVTAPSRAPEFPDLPTMAESGVPDMEVVSWAGFFAPARTPAAIVKKLQDEAIRAVKLPDVRQRMKALAVDPVGGTSAELAKIVAADTARWAAVAKAANLSLSLQ